MFDFNFDSDLLDFMADQFEELQEAMREASEDELQQLTSLKENFNVNHTTTSG